MMVSNLISIMVPLFVLIFAAMKVIGIGINLLLHYNDEEVVGVLGNSA